MGHAAFVRDWARRHAVKSVPMEQVKLMGETYWQERPKVCKGGCMRLSLWGWTLRLDRTAIVLLNAREHKDLLEDRDSLVRSMCSLRDQLVSVQALHDKESKDLLHELRELSVAISKGKVWSAWQSRCDTGIKRRLSRTESDPKLPGKRAK